MSFQHLTPEKRKEVASRGGISSHAQGKAHKWTSEEAKLAGKKGGIAKHKNNAK